MQQYFSPSKGKISTVDVKDIEVDVQQLQTEEQKLLDANNHLKSENVLESPNQLLAKKKNQVNNEEGPLKPLKETAK